MAKFKVMKYVYDDAGKAVNMASTFKELFENEGIYETHDIFSLQSGKFMVVVKVKA